MRNRRLSSKISIRNHESRSVEAILTKLFQTFSNKGSLIHQTSSQHNESNQNTTDKIECLRDLLMEITTNFSAAAYKSLLPKETEIFQILRDQAAESRQRFENDLIKHARSLSLCLLACMFQSQSSPIRILACRLVIALSHLVDFHSVFSALDADKFLMRIIDQNQSNSQVALAIEYIRLLVQLYPNDLNEFHLFTLMSFAENLRSDLSCFCIETILEIACKRPKLACKCKVFNDLIDFILQSGSSNTDNDFLIQMIMQCLFKVLDDKENRSLINCDDLFSSLISPFTDAEYVPVTYGTNHFLSESSQTAMFFDNQKNQQEQMHPRGINFNQLTQQGSLDIVEPKIENILSSCSTAIQAIFNNFAGIMCFTKNESKILKSLLSPLGWLTVKVMDVEQGQFSIETKMAADQLNEQLNEAKYMKFFQAKKNQLSKNFDRTKQLVVLNHLINLIYKIFKLEIVDLVSLAKKVAPATQQTQRTFNYTQVDHNDSLEEGFLNSECNKILNSFDAYFIETNDKDAIDQLSSSAAAENTRAYSYSPNTLNSFKTYLIKIFIEADLMESLLDLYFSLPITFNQNGLNTSNLGQYSSISDSGISYSIQLTYQNLSFKCLNLFAELFYLANNLFYDEFCIEDFQNIYNESYHQHHHHHHHQTDENRQSKNQQGGGIYNEMKKISLLTYLKYLNNPEREREVLDYINEFNTKRENVKNGVTLQSEKLASLSFMCQKFLSNSGYMSLKKYELELEVLNLNKNPAQKQLLKESNVFKSFMHSLVDDSATRERREVKRYATEIEKQMNELIDSTNLLVQTGEQFVPLTYYQSLSTTKEVQIYNWNEILRLFETYLLTASSIHPRFMPTRESLFLEANLKLLLDNQKLYKAIKKLFDFITPNPSITAATVNVPDAKMTHNRGIWDTLACTCCYLLDFTLLNFFNVSDLNERCEKLNELNKWFNAYEILLIQFLLDTKSFITNQFFNTTSTTGSIGSQLTNSGSNSSFYGGHQNRFSMSSMNFATARTLSKDSFISYILFMLGHLTSSVKGDFLLEKFKIYDLIIKLIETIKDVNIMKLIISTLNYYVSPRCRSILKACLSLSLRSFSSREQLESYIEFKIYAIKMIYNIFRSNILKFDVCFIDIIIKHIFILQTDSALPSNLGENRFHYKLDMTIFATTTYQCLYELSINLIEYILNLRPDLVNYLLKSRMTNIETLEMFKRLLLEDDKFINLMGNSRLIKSKLRLLFIRFLLSEEILKKTTMDQLEKLVSDWREHKLDKVYYQLIEKHFFDANAIDKHFGYDAEIRVDDEVELSNSDSIEHDPNEAESAATANKRSADPRPVAVNLYRRTNDPSKNDFHLSAQFACLYFPIHINSIIVRFQVFAENKYFINESFENKIKREIELIQSTAKHLSLNEFKQLSIDKNIRRLKIAMWSLASMCNCNAGIKYVSYLLSKHRILANMFEYFGSFLKIVEDHPALSVRAVGFYCLNLISKTYTGANLIGKLGWHTFQPNKSMPTKAFYSMITTIDSPQLDMDVYSSIDTAVLLYNINRAKLKFNLKTILRYFDRSSTDTEKNFLNKQARLDPSDLIDENLLKSFETFSLSIELFNENVCVPIRTNLLSADELYKTVDYYKNDENENENENEEKNKIERIWTICQKVSCIWCESSISSNGELSSAAADERVYRLIKTHLGQLMTLVSFEKSKLRLIRLKQVYPIYFNCHLFNYLVSKYFKIYRLNFVLRKFLQELFTDSIDQSRLFKNAEMTFIQSLSS